MIDELLDVDTVAFSPITQFERWFEQAREAGVVDLDNMAVATSAFDGRPSVRHVLLRGLDDRGFVFFTNFHSEKGRALTANRQAAAVFVWRELERQVRVRGGIERVTIEESEAYWATRPRGSQIAAWASPQSEVVESRAVLERSFAAKEAEYEGGDVPLPPFWGGIRIAPEEVEFWQGRPDRLHDRVRYRLAGDAGADGWVRERLAP